MLRSIKYIINSANYREQQYVSIIAHAHIYPCRKRTLTHQLKRSTHGHAQNKRRRHQFFCLRFARLQFIALPCAQEPACLPLWPATAKSAYVIIKIRACLFPRNTAPYTTAATSDIHRAMLQPRTWVLQVGVARLSPCTQAIHAAQRSNNPQLILPVAGRGGREGLRLVIKELFLFRLCMFS